MSERLAIGFANASLSSGGALRAWLEDDGGLEATEAAEVSLRLPEFAGFQIALRELFDASIGGGPFPAAVERVNEASARVPRVMRLRPGESVEVPAAASATAVVLARVAWSAIELLGGPERSSLRRCPADGRYFVATRSDRVWCSDACGNRTRVARHHARRRASA
jgi:predicted RNA-binding Zn ribbon-like protein